MTAAKKIIQGPYADRDDAVHVLAQLPPVGGPERADPRFIAAVEKWDGSRNSTAGGLVLMGPTGSGKTTAVVHCIRHYLAQHEIATSTLWVLASDLADDRTGSLLEQAKRVRLLVIDDIGKEDDPKRRLFAVLDHRHTRNPTIITTGLSAADLDRTYDGATRRRMFEFRGTVVRTVNIFKQDVTPRLVTGPGDQEELARRAGEKL